MNGWNSVARLQLDVWLYFSQFELHTEAVPFIPPIEEQTQVRSTCNIKECPDKAEVSHGLTTIRQEVLWTLTKLCTIESCRKLIPL